MKKVTEKLSNGNIIAYDEVDGVCYETGLILRDGTVKNYLEVPSLIPILESCIGTQYRYRVWYGDNSTGEAWPEENEVTGYIKRSTGTIKIPLLVHNRRSYGGGALLVSSIVRLDCISTREILWESGKFYVPDMKIKNIDDSEYLYSVIRSDNGEVIASFKKQRSAYRYVDFLTGKRYSL